MWWMLTALTSYILFGSVVGKCPPGYGDVAHMFYFCPDSKVHVEVSKDLLEMFAKSKDSK